MASTTRVAAGVGVRITTLGVERAAGFGWSVARGVGLGEGAGDALADAEADALGDGRLECFADGRALGVGRGLGEAVGANVAVAPGSGVKLGRAVGACNEPPVPRILVSNPPSNKPPKITRIMSGMMGSPPRLGGSGSSLRRRG